ncbi:unnamed protein product [Cylindrotheca closterium]|uniref:Uncharacterized protein n=1 Tax=Cylindrotheca closterium TaxID=2856 RepID=A0AAD2JNI2_9STRA|nr:unnamed protein product [Cylindrotheca closterium]
MLPYHLRVPVYGKQNEHIKRSAAEEKAVAARGGPVQVAIEEDILLLQAKYVNQLLAKKQRENQHDEEGFAFLIFRELFAHSKVAMLHLLLPKSSCDKEAYSQLIYAACLQVFRKAFSATNGAEISLENSGFSLFCLYALYETNPLPREMQSPFELLSMGLQGDENYKALYRRVFRQNIRIDHGHYSFLLQLRHLCLARIDACGKRLFGHRSHYQSSDDPLHAHDTFKCNCAIAKDTIHIMNLLVTRWDYCDYTGPVGLEGLAGHSDYVSTESTKNASDPIETTTSSPEPLSAVLKKALQAYQHRVREIQVPAGRTHTATKVRKSLEDFFASTRNDPLSQVEARLFGTGGFDHQDTQEASRNDMHPSRNNSKESDETNSRVFVAGEKHATGNKNADATLPSFKSVIPPGLQDETKNYLHRALGALFERQLPFLETTALIGGDSTDDVSSVGFGGISVATGGGRNALQALLSKANIRKGVPSRVGAANNTNEVQRNNSAMQFLTADNALMNDEVESDGDDSDVSNLSLSDYEDDDDKFDDASVATSAAGKQALSSLLNQVKKSQTQSRKPARAKKRHSLSKRSTPTAVKAVMKLQDSADTVSVSTSVGGGQNALATLLGTAQPRDRDSASAKRANAGRNSKGARGSQTRKSKRVRVSKESTTERDELSMASSIGHGQNALGDLLRQARDTKHGSLRSPSDGGSSASSVGAGRGALSTLLAHSGEKKVSSEDTSEDTSELASLAASSMGQGQGALNSLMLLTQSSAQQEDDADSVSVATSIGAGRGALDILLKQTGQTSDDEGSDS